MVKALTSLTLGCVFALTLSVAASACEYHNQQAQASAAETAQATDSQPASEKN